VIELQQLVLPDLGVCQEVKLYAACVRHAYYSYQSREVRVAPGGCASFATLYGGFSIGKWRRVADIRDLRLRLDVSGEGQVSVWNWRSGHERRLLTAADVSSDDGVEIRIPLDDDVAGIIAPDFEAWCPSVLRGGSWLTEDTPRRAVRLGIVITTFRREAAVMDAVRRLSSGLAGPKGLDADVVVVDNGRTLSPGDVPGAHLIPNKNLGGSGGFARGLCHLQDNLATRHYTHAVFMDDDATAEIESLRRASRLLQYVRDDRLAIASGLLFAEYPGIQLEAAGQMTGDYWVPLRHGVDLRITENLVENELPLPADYGGWWMFFFPIRYVSNLPFPFFIRGDDVEFPRANALPLITLNGVCSFGADFFRKESPANVALDRRGRLVNVLLHGSTRSAVQGVFRGMEMAVAFGNRYCYDHADALAEGTRDVLAGADGFAEIAGFADGRRRELAACSRQPRLTGRQIPTWPEVAPRRRSALWHAMRLLLLNGHLLPRFLLIRRPITLGTVWMSPGSEVFLRPRVLIREGLGDAAIMAERDVMRYFAALSRMLWLSLKLLIALPRLRREFRRARARFGSRPYWESQFGDLGPDA
jgi:hypothetical protein